MSDIEVYENLMKIYQDANERLRMSESLSDVVDAQDEIDIIKAELADTARSFGPFNN